jgi:hypothetical protein
MRLSIHDPPPPALADRSSEELEERFRVLRRLTAEEALLLCELHRRQRHRELGYKRFADYCRDHLDLAPTTFYRWRREAQGGPDSDSDPQVETRSANLNQRGDSQMAHAAIWAQPNLSPAAATPQNAPGHPAGRRRRGARYGREGPVAAGRTTPQQALAELREHLDALGPELGSFLARSTPLGHVLPYDVRADLDRMLRAARRIRQTLQTGAYA